MTVPDDVRSPKIVLDRRAPSRHDRALQEEPATILVRCRGGGCRKGVAHATARLATRKF
jgi:hypothetical protein